MQKFVKKNHLSKMIQAIVFNVKSICDKEFYLNNQFL